MLNIEQTIEGLHKLLDQKKKIADSSEICKTLFGDAITNLVQKGNPEEIETLESAILILTLLKTNTNGAGSKDNGRTEHNEI